jgi:hypothetical protein
MRYQQFASHVYCGAVGPVAKMASKKENAFCVLRFKVSRSVTTVQREFRAQLKKKTLFLCGASFQPHMKQRVKLQLCAKFADRRGQAVSVPDPYGLNLAFLDRSHYFSFQVAPQLDSRG